MARAPGGLHDHPVAAHQLVTIFEGLISSVPPARRITDSALAPSPPPNTPRAAEK